VGFATSGVIVDETTLDLFANISDALKGLAAAIEQVEARVRILENGR
jgi:predicted ATPase